MEKVEKKNKVTLDGVGKDIQRRLNGYFKQYGSGLEFRTVMSSQSYRAKALGMDVGELSDKLEAGGYIKVLWAPGGQRFVFSGTCPLSEEQMQEWLHDQEIMRETQKEMKKQAKAL